MRVKASNKLSEDVRVLDFGPNGPDFTETDGHVQVSGLASASDLPVPISFSHTGTVSVGVGVTRLPIPFVCRVTQVLAAINTAPTGTAVICDIHKNGSTIFTTQANRPTIAANGNESTLAVPDVTSFTVGDYLSVDIDQVGSIVAGSDLVVVIVLATT